ncbi:MAG: hypothetical protein IIY71_05550 [Oscillospiraceae bacterium]|nr:hypothetical protein [Oscillospiraceae bacterium]
MKQFAVLMAAGIMIFSLTACGGNMTPPAPASDAPTMSDLPSGTPDSTKMPVESDVPANTGTGAATGNQILDTVLSEKLGTGYLAREEGQTLLIAETADQSKAVVLSIRGEEKTLLFGTCTQREDGTVTVTDDATGEAFTAVFSQDESGNIVIAMEDGTRLTAESLEAENITGALQELAIDLIQ